MSSFNWVNEFVETEVGGCLIYLTKMSEQSSKYCEMSSGVHINISKFIIWGTIKKEKLFGQV